MRTYRGFFCFKKNAWQAGSECTKTPWGSRADLSTFIANLSRIFLITVVYLTWEFVFSDLVRFFVSEAKKLTLTSLSGPKHARAVAFYNCYKRRHIVAIWIGLVYLFILLERNGKSWRRSAWWYTGRWCGRPGLFLARDSHRGLA